MQAPQSPDRRCPLPDCPSFTQRSRPRVIRHSRMTTKATRKRRYLCQVCKRTFVATTGTVYTRMRRPKGDFDRAAQMIAEGMSKAAIARVLGISPSTVSRWLQKAGRLAEAFQAQHVRSPDAVEIQIDELSTGGTGKARDAWAYSGIEVWSRLWMALKVGNRTLRNTFEFTRRLGEATWGNKEPILITSDAFKYYEPAMTRVFRHRSLAYVQVTNTYRRRGIARSDVRQVLGTEDDFGRAMDRSEDSKRPNTAYIERLNSLKRSRCSLIRRRNPAPARSVDRLTEALELVRVFYNFVHGHSSLKFGRVKRTPAMQAGLFSKPLSIREIFSWVPPAGKPYGRRVATAMKGEVR